MRNKGERGVTMLDYSEEKEKLILEIRELRRKAIASKTTEEEQQYRNLAIEKEDELLSLEFGRDRNIGRFNKF